MIKKYTGEILLIIGSGLFTFNFFNWSYKTDTGFNVFNYMDSGMKKITGAVYYYPLTSIILLSVAVMMMVLGILIIKNKIKL